jgi:hypothetical protein
MYERESIDLYVLYRCDVNVGFIFEKKGSTLSSSLFSSFVSEVVGMFVLRLKQSLLRLGERSLL